MELDQKKSCFCSALLRFLHVDDYTVRFRKRMKNGVAKSDLLTASSALTISLLELGIYFSIFSHEEAEIF